VKKLFLAFGFACFVGFTVILAGTTGCGNNTPTSNPTPTATCSGPGTYGDPGSGGSANTVNLMTADRVDFPQKVVVTDVAAYLCIGVSGTGNATAGIYSDVSAYPGTLMGPAATGAVSTCGTPYTFTFASPMTLKTGHYWIVVGINDSSTTYSLDYDFNSATNYAISGGPLPATFPTTISGAESWPYVIRAYADWTCP
jgi:hypothetical protein